MVRVAFAGIAVLLAAWAALANRGNVTPPVSTDYPLTLVRDDDTRRLMNQFDQIQSNLTDARDDSLSLNNRRRLMEDARSILEAARNRLLMDQSHWQQKLDAEFHALRESEQQLRIEWGRLLAQSEKAREQWLHGVKLAVRTGEPDPVRRYAIVDRTLFPSPSPLPAAAAPSGNHEQPQIPRVAESNAPADLYSVTRLATAYEIPDTIALRPNTEQRLDKILQNLESIEKRFQAAIVPKSVFNSETAPTIIGAEPPLRWDTRKPNTVTDTLSFSWQAVFTPQKSKSDTANTVANKLDAIAELIERMEKRMLEVEGQKSLPQTAFTARSEPSPP
jgi:hypothetical protein